MLGWCCSFLIVYWCVVVHCRPRRDPCFSAAAAFLQKQSKHHCPLLIVACFHGRDHSASPSRGKLISQFNILKSLLFFFQKTLWELECPKGDITKTSTIRPLVNHGFHPFYDMVPLGGKRGGCSQQWWRTRRYTLWCWCRGTADWFGVGDNDAGQQERWQQRSRRHCNMRLGPLKPQYMRELEEVKMLRIISPLCFGFRTLTYCNAFLFLLKLSADVRYTFMF